MNINLTDEQKLILDNCKNNLYVSSAPGSGKSTLLSLISKKILEEDETAKICLLTFTNKAAESIISKCGQLDSTRIISGTFHGVAHRLMQRAGIRYSICDEHKKRLIIKTLFHCRKDKEQFENLYVHISNAKSKYPMELSPSVISYNNELARYNLIDFDDILYRFISYVSSRDSLTCSNDVLGITHCIVDELQDTSAPQLEMLKKIATKTSCKMIGASDDDQVIYEFRNARPENIQDFIKIFGCKVMNMGVNFRSDKKIIKHATILIENNKKRIAKVIKANSTNEGTMVQYRASNPFEQIDYIIIKCQQHPGTHIAILYRNRTFKYHIEFALRKAGLDYKVNDFLDITDRSAVRVMISCLKIASDQYDIFDLEQAARALKGLGAAGVKKLGEEANKGSLKTVVANWLADPKKQKKLTSIKFLQDTFKANINSALDILVRFAEEVFLKSFDYQAEMRAFLIDVTKTLTISTESIHSLADELGLNGSTEEQGSDDAKIELSTLHGAKGAEYNIVIMPFCEQYERQPNKEYDLEAERRLFYVGITRAKSKLYLCYSGLTPRFIQELKL